MSNLSHVEYVVSDVVLMIMNSVDTHFVLSVMYSKYDHTNMFTSMYTTMR